MSVCPACRHFSLCSWLHLQMANAKLGLCSRPAPAPGHLFSTQRQTDREGNVLLLPTPGLLEKILPAPADFITSPPEDPKVPGPRGEGSLEEAAGWLVLAHRWGHTSEALAPCHSPSDNPVKGKLVAPA